MELQYDKRQFRLLVRDDGKSDPQINFTTNGGNALPDVIRVLGAGQPLAPPDCPFIGNAGSSQPPCS